jgi:protein-tyrosine-phosphatase
MIHGGDMNERIYELAEQAGFENGHQDRYGNSLSQELEKFAELIVAECINREELLGAIARGWCSEKNSHKTMDPDLALAIFDEVERQIKQHFGVEE